MSEFYIAGVQFHEYKKVLNDLTEEQVLTLTPEPDNKYDPNAVKIEAGGVMLGYVPKKLSAEISAMIETGDTECKIIALVKTAKPWEMIKVNVSKTIEDEA